MSQKDNSKPGALNVPAQSQIHDIKISDAILRLSEPLRKKYTDIHRTQAVVAITIMAWNMSLFPKEERLNVHQILIGDLSKKIRGKDLSILLDNINALIDRKDKEYPFIREYILKHTLSFSGDTITLTVETTEVPEEILRKVLQSENHKINTKGSYKFKA